MTETKSVTKALALPWPKYNEIFKIINHKKDFESY